MKSRWQGATMVSDGLGGNIQSAGFIRPVYSGQAFSLAGGIICVFQVFVMLNLIQHLFLIIFIPS